MADEPTITALVVNAIVVGAAWVAGEGGRIIVAGGFGGFARWMQTEKRRVRDGVIAVAGGSVAATYLWPLVLAIVGAPFGGLEQNVNNVAMAAFVAGAGGMSILKVATAMIEAKASKGSDDNA